MLDFHGWCCNKQHLINNDQKIDRFDTMGEGTWVSSFNLKYRNSRRLDVREGDVGALHGFEKHDQALHILVYCSSIHETLENI